MPLDQIKPWATSGEMVTLEFKRMLCAMLIFGELRNMSINANEGMLYG